MELMGREKIKYRLYVAEDWGGEKEDEEEEGAKNTK